MRVESGFVLDLSPLTELLAEEVEVVRQLVALADEKRRAIVERDTQAVERATTAEWGLLDRLEGLERRRGDWVRAEARRRRDQERAEGPVTLGEMLSRLPLDDLQGSAVRRIAGELSSALTELRERNELNAGLLYHALACTRQVFDALTEEDPRRSTYQPASGGAAKRPSGAGRRLVDWRA